jgi:hypothetical protein
MPHEGGCACGAVRYLLEPEPFDAGYCHCTMCRRSAGAPVLAFATVPLDRFFISKGEPAKRRSSSFGERWFCRDCGAQLAMHVDHQPDTIDFAIASLDHPNIIAPAFHIFIADRIGWFDTTDEHPRHARFRPHTRGL